MYRPVFALILHTCLVAALAGPLCAPALAQTAPAPVAADQQVYDRYRDWTYGVPVEQRGDGLMDRYRAHLKAQGVADAQIARQVQIIEAEGRRLEAERWNQYFTSDKPRFNLMPNGFMIQMVERRTPGTALDMGMGMGRNSIWLARQGWEVTGFDPADQAMALARQQAGVLGLKNLTTVVARDDTFDWGENRWDLILLSYAGCAEGNVPRIEKALKPGGLLVVEAFHTDATRQFKIGGSICATGQLPHIFQGLRTVHYEEPVALPDFAPARARVVRYAAEKPR